MDYHKKYIKYKTKYINAKRNNLQIGGCNIDLITFFISELSQIYPNIIFDNPPEVQQYNQSVFYMPIISFAYYIVKNIKNESIGNIPENLYKNKGIIIKLADYPSAGENIFIASLCSVIEYLQKDNNLTELENAYMEKGGSLPNINAGHISLSNQEKIFDNSYLNGDACELIKELFDCNVFGGDKINLLFLYEHLIARYYGILNTKLSTKLQKEGNNASFNLNDLSVSCPKNGALKSFHFVRKKS